MAPKDTILSIKVNTTFRIFLVLLLLIAVAQIPAYSQITISGPLTVIGGGSATYYSTPPSSCYPADMCGGEASSWSIVGGTITYWDPFRCDVNWNAGGGEHKLTMNYNYFYILNGYSYQQTGTDIAYITTTYQYTKEDLESYTIDTSTISSRNYTHIITPRKEYTSSTLPASNESRDQDISESFVIFDGLGRTTRSAQIQAGPKGEDIYQYREYDAFGRETRQYLPFYYDRNLSSDLYKSNLKTLTLDLYDPVFNYAEDGNFTADEKPWVQAVMDESPLNRVLESGLVGEDWQPTDQSGESDGHTNKISRVLNESSDNVRIWTLSNETISSSSLYSAESLFKTIVTNPDGNRTIEYVNKDGQLILSEQVLSGTDNLRTYYVYDDWGLLRFVLPPKLVADHVPSGSTSVSIARTSTSFSRLGYYYEYDKYKRLIEKQLPGAGVVEIVYDKRDRVVAIQDENQRNSTPKQWTFTRYDKLNRTIQTGLFEYASSRENLQTLADSYSGSDLYETIDLSASGIHSYSNNSFPDNYVSDTSDFLLVAYFDDYSGMESGFTEDGFSLNAISGFSNIDSLHFNQSFDSIPTGMSTGMKIRNLEDSTWYSTSLYYDRWGRLIQSKSENHLSGIDRVCLTYEGLTTDVIEKVHEHKSQYDNINYGERYIYDHRGRILEAYHQMSGQDEVLVSAYEYNDIGQLDTKYLYSTDTMETKGLLQKVDMNYNIQGWLTAVNDPDNLESDLYAFELGYNDSTLVSSSLGQTSIYGGNISAMRWKSDDDPVKAYAYTYDNAGRLTNANYGRYGAWTTDDFDVSGITYDENGNISRLTRRDDTQIMDSLEYTYTGNQLTAVRDDGDLNNGFTYTGSPSNYSYDYNGNLENDYYKGMEVSYNVLNLPRRIDFGSDDIEYIYTAAGAKLQKKVNQTTTSITDYVGNIIYQDGEIVSIMTSEGRMVPTGTNSEFNYEYHLKDHLGNTRVAFEVVDGAPTIRQVADYYPFGMTSSLQTSSNNDFLYNGKEIQTELNLDWYDYGFRFYDPVLGRWHVPDPLSESHYGLNPYHYVFNNPIRFIDPFGLDGEDPPWPNLLPGASITRTEITVQYGLSPMKIGLQEEEEEFDYMEMVVLPYIRQESTAAGEYADRQRAEQIQQKRLREHGDKYKVKTSKVGGYGYEDDVSGVGMSIEFAVPRCLLIRKNDYSGAGIDFGIVRDFKGWSFFATTKTSMQSGFAFSLQLEGFSAIRRSSSDPPIDRMDLRGPGYEVGIGFFVGGAYSTDNSADYGMTPEWHMLTGSLGLDFSYVEWNTNTYVSGKR